MNYTAIFIVTAYSWSCGATGLTRNERWPTVGQTVAVDPKVVPMLSRIEIEGLTPHAMIGHFVAEDTGGAIKGRHLDVFMGSCEQAREFGRRLLRVKVKGRSK